MEVGAAIRSTIISAPPTSPQQQLAATQQHRCRMISGSSWSSSSNPISFAKSSLKFIYSSTSPTSVPVIEEELPVSNTESTPDPDSLPPLSGCKACGREEIEKGCNGEGRIQGGIATVPGFGWWPIKAYRPCPGFLAAGGRYKRQGQSMDEVASGRAKRTNKAA